jgi:hypothetical protein
LRWSQHSGFGPGCVMLAQVCHVDCS